MNPQPHDASPDRTHQRLRDTLRTTFPGATDCHAHVIGPTARYPFAATRTYTPADAPYPAWRAMLEDLGLARGVIIQGSFHGTDNRCTLDALAEGGAMARAIVCAPTTASAAELAALRRPGVSGLRITFAEAGQDFAAIANDRAALDTQAATVAAMARSHGFHLQLFQHPPAWPVLLPRLVDAGVSWVVDHLGMVPASEGVSAPAFRAIVAALACGRGWVKLSGFYRLSQQPGWADVAPMVRALAEAAPERCVWGSDWPHTGMDTPVATHQTLDVLLDWITDPALRRAILVDNPARLYGYPPA